jgi:hypothetical protein
MKKMLIPALTGASLMLGGCVARTVWDVATLPVKAGSKVVDVATTSQSEADRNYGRKARQKETREGRERREYDEQCRKQRKNCDRYDGYRASDD